MQPADVLLPLDLELIQDNSTRWNSHYLSIQRALKLRARLNTFCEHFSEVAGEDALSDVDWEQLEVVATALKPFFLLTKDLEGRAVGGHHGSAWEWLPTIEWLLQHLGHGREAASKAKNATLAIAFQNARQKLQKY